MKRTILTTVFIFVLSCLLTTAAYAAANDDYSFYYSGEFSEASRLTELEYSVKNKDILWPLAIYPTDPEDIDKWEELEKMTDKGFKYKSSNSDVVRVSRDENGEVDLKFLKKGEAVVTASYDGKTIATLNVKVVEGIRLTKKNVKAKVKKTYTYDDFDRFWLTKFIYKGKALTPVHDYVIDSTKSVGSRTLDFYPYGKYYSDNECLKYRIKIVPKGTTVKKLVKGKKKITVKWKKQSEKMSQSRITGYQVQVATDKKFTKNKKTVKVKGYKKTSKTIRKLKSGKKYYVRVRTYKVVKSKSYYSKWSKTKTIKVN